MSNRCNILLSSLVLYILDCNKLGLGPSFCSVSVQHLAQWRPVTYPGYNPHWWVAESPLPCNRECLTMPWQKMFPPGLLTSSLPACKPQPECLHATVACQPHLGYSRLSPAMAILQGDPNTLPVLYFPPEMYVLYCLVLYWTIQTYIKSVILLIELMHAHLVTPNGVSQTLQFKHWIRQNNKRNVLTAKRWILSEYTQWGIKVRNGYKKNKAKTQLVPNKLC